MSTLSNQANLMTTSRRRPLFMLLFALLILAAAIVVRLVKDRVTPAAVTAPPAPIERTSPDALGQLQERIQRNPNDPATYAELGLTLLQQVRVTGDVNLYGRAGQAFDNALQRDPQQVDALAGKGILALALHDFKGALQWADKAWALNPFRAQILGIKVDGLVELGRYPEAVETLQKMVDKRPDLSSYSRVSYLRELYGDADGAKQAMQSAVEMGAPGTEEWMWTLVHLGNLYWNSGQLEQAAQIYQQVLSTRADYPYAIAGLARVEAAQGQHKAAIARYEGLVTRLPLPEFVVALGELYEITGDPAKAQQQYDLVRTMQKLNAAAGMNVDLELATFEVNHGGNQATALAQARAAYAQRPTIYAADTLGWAFYKAQNYTEAQKYSQEAMRLKTRDPLLYFHAGMIAAALGQVDQAQAQLKTALAINPNFSLLYAPQAQAKLKELQ
jgi:tetratricopeptide (TPR) repeat protein